MVDQEDFRLSRSQNTSTGSSLILALDIGSSSIRASIYDDDADPLPQCHARLERCFAATHDGGSELDADAELRHIERVIDMVLEKSEHLAGEITHVAVCSYWHSLVGVDQNGRPTTKVLGWADTRSRGYSARLKRDLRESEVHNRTGARFHSSFWPAKLLWLRHGFPDVWSRTVRWLSFSDYLALQLFDSSVTSVSMASGTGIFRQREIEWDAALLEYLQIGRAQLPELARDDTSTVRFDQKYRTRWPRLADAEWYPAVGDGAADHVGSCGVGPHTASLMVGTSGAMRVAFEGGSPDHLPDGLWCYRLDRRRVIVGGAISDGGNLYRWAKETFRLPDDADEQIASRPIGANKLIFLPFLNGERSTGYNELARGSIVRLTSSHDGIDILQAALEGVALRFGEIYRQINEITDLDQIVCSGAGLRESPVWGQIIADVIGHDLTISGVREASSRGAVLLALESLGKIDGIGKDASAATGQIASRPDRHKLYNAERDRYREAYDLLVNRS